MEQLLLLFLQAMVALQGLLLRLPFSFASTTINHASSDDKNFIQNGSFEEGHFNFTAGLNIEPLWDTTTQDYITGWVRASGSVDVAKGRWKRASDCTPTCIDLNGGGPGELTTSFQLASASSNYTILLDATVNPEASSPVNGNFTVAVISAQNITINSSLVYVDGHGYDMENIGWHTFGVVFVTPSDLQGNLTLSLSSHIQGWYGPLIDNVRVHEGLHFPDSEEDATCLEDRPAEGGKPTLILAIVIPSILLIFLCVGVLIWWKRKRSDYEVNKAMSALQDRLKFFPYNALKISTKNFHEDNKLGEGTFGAVYKGILEDGSEVAVKQLFSSTPQGQEEFLNEAMVISTVQHRNLVALKGCCVKGHERFLVCEYVENKSLHQVLWGGASIHLDWPTRFQIVVGTARGLAYLHEASQPRIIHRDIKASNILLNKSFEAKIADFGLAKLLPDDKTHVSTRIAGTLGYLAPEYAMRGQLSEKADVYSFGVVVLELVSGRKNLDYSRPLEDQFLLDWAKKLCSEGRMKELIDPKLQVDSQTKEEILRVIRVGLWCTQQVAATRPTMSGALSMLLQGVSSQNDMAYSFVENIEDTETAIHPFYVNNTAGSFSMSSSTADNTTSSYFSSIN